MTITRRAFATTFCAALAAPARAQEKFPSRPVKIVNTLAAGSATDVRARIIAGELTRLWGQQAIVENRPGGGGVIGVQAVLQAPADGHTLLAAPGSIFQLLPAQNDALPFDVNRDLAPIGLTSVEPMLIAVSPRLGVGSFAELLALAKSKPHEIAIGTNAAGSLPHLAARLIEQRTGAPFTIVPYATGGVVEALKDLLGGRIHVLVEARPSLVGHLASGDLKALAVMSPERLSNQPDIPSTDETMPGLHAVGWSGLVAPRATPEAVRRQLGEDLRKALENPDVIRRVDQIGTPYKPLYGADFARFIEAEQKQWHPMIRALAGK